MAIDLRKTIDGLASSFADNIVGAIRTLSLDDLAMLSGGTRRGVVPARKSAHSKRIKKRVRRSEAELRHAAASVVGLIHKAGKAGINAEHIRAELKLPKPVITRAIADSLEGKTIKKRGQKRATVYYRG